MKRKIRNDITNAIEKIEDSLKAKINEFIQARWGVLEDKVDEIVNGEETILEKNEEIYDKIDQVENVNDKFVNAINELIGSLDINAIKEKLNSILRRGTSEFAAAIEYLENHLVRSEYDIEVVNNQSEEIDINRAKEILILDRLFTPNELMEHLELVNDLGTLEIDANNRNKVPNKARILVKDNGEVQKEYDVVVKGDINNNGAITVTDVILAAYYSLESIELDEYEILAADINNNKKVTVTDVYLIAMKALEGGN